MISINKGDLISWWNLPFCWLFGILFSPIGLVLATIELFSLKINKIETGNMYSYWASVLRPGFFFGLYFAILLAGFYLIPLQYFKNRK